MALKLITPAVDAVLSLDEAKAHLRVDFDDDDGLIAALIDAVVDYVEGPRGYLARALADQTWDYYLDGFPIWRGSLAHHYHRHDHLGSHRVIELPLPPLIEVIGVFYKDSSGTEQQLDASTYVVDDASEPARISPAPGKYWPAICSDPFNSVRIRFRAGYLDNSSPPELAVPRNIKAALLMFLSTLYENRSESEVGLRAAAVQLPFASAALLSKYVAARGFA